MENLNTHDEITEDDFAQLAEILEEGNEEPTVREPDALDLIQEELRDLLGDSSQFGAPMTISMPGGQDIVYRQRKPLDRPDVEFDSRRATPKSSSVSKAIHNSWNGEGKKKKLAASRRGDNNLVEQFPVAHELVEYVSGGGQLGNVSRMMAQLPPEIHSIEDIADSIDWHLLKKGINSEHIETALSKDKGKVVLFMDDRAQPRLGAIKEILSKFGEPRVIQKADQVSEATGQPHGFYVFELAPDNAVFTPKTASDAPGSTDWDKPDKRSTEITDSVRDFDDVLFEEVYEPFCSTCGDELFEGRVSKAFKQARSGWRLGGVQRKLGKLKGLKGKEARDAAGSYLGRPKSLKAVKNATGKTTVAGIGRSLSRNREAAAVIGAAGVGAAAYGAHKWNKKRKAKNKEAFDARVGDPKGTKRKDHKSTLGDSIECASCSTLATEINEHSFNGIFCARHGDRLDKYSRACYSCKSDTVAEELNHIACPECSSQTTMEALGCGVCGTEFTEDVANDYASHIADSLFSSADDDDLLEAENNWNDPFSMQLADSLFDDEEDEDSFV